jgi:energy-converting hydrogenase Eha subunit F
MIKDEPSKALMKRGNRASKYLLYAIFEIVLLVMGILVPKSKNPNESFPSWEGNNSNN